MRNNSKILWSEGMFLSPHHFQQWEEYQEQALDFRLKSIVSFNWGLTGLEINSEGLPNGNFSIINSSGLFPDGTVFSAPDRDAPVLSRVFKEFLSPSTQTLDVFLAIPKRNPESKNVSDDSPDTSRSTRYRKDSLKVVDQNTGENEIEVQIARNNLHLLFSGEDLSGYEYLQIARLKQEGDGAIVLDDAFIPPCLHIACSSVLMGIVRRLSEMLNAKSASLSEERSQRTAGIVEFSSNDLVNFWLLHTVNSFIPTLNHNYRIPRIHPEALYVSLARLAGALTTFSPDLQPGDIPVYDHGNLARSFLGLEDIIQELLKAVVPVGAMQIPIEKESDSKFSARIVSDQLLSDSQIFLAAKADLPESQLIEELPKQSKISSTDQVNSLLGLALPGVLLRHRPAPPAPLRVKLGYQYFRFEVHEDPESRKHWDAICKSRTLAIRLPGQRFPGLKIELWSIKE
jgi:type VI secretion system protein ImpJ